MPPVQQGASEPMLVTLTREDFDLVLDALDSHIYWHLSDERYRQNGDVLEPGTDDEENAQAIHRARSLLSRLESLKLSEP